jgi:hypothetical protein
MQPTEENETTHHAPHPSITVFCLLHCQGYRLPTGDQVEEGWEQVWRKMEKWRIEILNNLQRKN